MPSPRSERPTTIWITWEHHRRTRETSRQLGVELLELTTSKRGLGRYSELAARTFRVLRDRKPQVLIVQNPSLVLGFLATCLRPLFGYRLVVDAHNVAVDPYESSGRLGRILTAIVLKGADRTIVTNRHLVEKVHAAGGRALILPDPLPEFDDDGRTYPFERRDLANVVLVATFADDEPVAEILEATGRLQDLLHLHVTGRAERLADHVREAMPPNVTLTGFLDDQDYVALLRSADLVVDLTTKEACLVCGAYEAVALGTPLVLSDDPATREYFTQGVVYSPSDVDGIEEALRRGVEEAEALRHAVRQLSAELTVSWPDRLAGVETEIAQLA